MPEENETCVATAAKVIDNPPPKREPAACGICDRANFPAGEKLAVVETGYFRITLCWMCRREFLQSLLKSLE